MLIGLGLSALGNGLVMALFVVYLNQVRGFDLRTAGLILTFEALFRSGRVAARRQHRRPGRTAARPRGRLPHHGVADGGVRLRHHGAAGIGVAAVMAMGNGAMWPPQAALLAACQARAPPARVRPAVHDAQPGPGLGGLVAAAILDVHRPSTFHGDVP